MSQALLDGLMAELPTVGTRWSLRERAKWLRAAESIFDLVYEAASADERDAHTLRSVQHLVDELQLAEARASVALDHDPRMQTLSVDTRPDISEPERAENESGEWDSSSDNITELHSLTDRIPLQARRLQRKGRMPAIKCVEPDIQHLWDGRQDSDGWYRCLNGCGAGRRYAYGSKVYAPEEVNAHPNEPGYFGSSTHARPEPAVEVPASAEPAADAHLDDGEAEEDEPPDEPTAELERPDIFREGFRRDDDGNSPEIRVGGIDYMPTTADLEEHRPELDSDDIELRGRGRLIDGALLAARARPEPTHVLVKAGPKCERCGEQLLTERDVVDGSMELVCINGHRRTVRSREELEALASEVELQPGKLRKREPSINGMRLG